MPSGPGAATRADGDDVSPLTTSSALETTMLAFAGVVAAAAIPTGSSRARAPSRIGDLLWMAIP
jgi:hypothetical protein